MATSLIVLFIGFSFIGGCGAGFVAISSYGSTSYYFDGNRAKAIGLQQTGIGVGLLALPIFFNYLFHEYSWRGALLIFGGIAGNICVLSLLIKSLPNEPSQLNRRKNLKRRELYMKNAEYHDYHLNQLNVLIDQNCGNGPEENIMKEKIENMKHISKSCEDCNDNYLSLQANEDNLDMFDGTVPINFRRSPASTMHSCDTTKTEDHYKSFISLPENVTRMVRPKLFYLRWLLPETREMIKGTFNLKLFKNWKYVLVLISACIRSLGVYGPFLYLVEMAENDNVDPARAPLIISGLGIANMISRCTTGILLDSKIIGPVSLEILLSFILAMILAIPTFVCHTLSSYIIYATVYGLAFGASAMLIAILLIHIVGLDSFTNANGFYYMSISFPIISGSYLTGWVRDLSEGYTNTFFLCSALLVVSGLTLLPVLWHDHYGGKNKGTNS
ncbi:hypothetical protein SNEBB_000100 [Seison nebaliae]|nr:hypothetical protein SNEBB_000100 [Seison nebaliae]